MADVRLPKVLPGIILILALMFLFAFKPFKTIPPGRVGVASLFGKVVEQPFPEGFHWVNPIYNWDMFDARKQSLEALKEISKDPAAKVYFMNGDSTQPLPLLNLGDR